jgi:hypothetical protein
MGFFGIVIFSLLLELKNFIFLTGSGVFCSFKKQWLMFINFWDLRAQVANSATLQIKDAHTLLGNNL